VRSPWSGYAALRWPPGKVVSGVKDVSVDKYAGSSESVARDRWRALWGQGYAIRRAGKQHSPREITSKARRAKG